MQTYSLDEKNKWVVLDPLSIGMPIKELRQRETFFRIDNAQNLFQSNDGYILEVTATGYLRHYPTVENKGIVTITDSDGYTHEIDVIRQMLNTYFTADDSEAYPVNLYAYDASIRNIAVLSQDDVRDLLLATFHDQGKNGTTFQDRMIDYLHAKRGNVKRPLNYNSLAYFDLVGANNKIYETKGGVIGRVRDKYKDVETCDEWSDDNPDALGNIKKWVIENYYYYPSHLSIDKDIICMWQNKVIYSPDTCMFVPTSVNDFFKNSRIEDMLSPNNNNTDDYIQSVTGFIETEKELEPSINHQSHRKLIAELERVLAFLKEKKDG